MGQRATDLDARGSVHGNDDEELAESTAAARADIELTRAEMTSTIDEIQGRLDPEVLSEHARDTAHDVTDYAVREAKEAAREITDHAIEQATEAVHEITGQARAALREATIGKVEIMAHTASESVGGLRQSVFDTIKANPMPAALVGLGVSWMFLNRPTARSAAPGTVNGYASGGRAFAPTTYSTRPYGGRIHGVAETESGIGAAANAAQQSVGRAVDRVQQTAGEGVEQVQSTASQMMEQVGDTSGQVIDQVQEQASRAQGFLQRQLEENPLLVGAVAVAIGSVLAGTVRSTPREDEMLGPARDRLMGNAKELTHETMDKVSRVLDEAQSAAKQEAKEQSLVPESSST